MDVTISVTPLSYHGESQVSPSTSSSHEFPNHAPAIRLTSGPQGWLSPFMTRNTHRDISTGNIPLAKKETVPGSVGEAPSPPFAYPASFESVLKTLDERHKNRSGDDAKLWEDMQKAKDAMEELLRNEISSTTACAAFLDDVDYARPTDLLWEDGKTSWKQRFGTAQFMSTDVIFSIGNEGGVFLQSPADDLESFFHVTVFAIFHNVYTVEDTLSHRDRYIKSLLLSKKTRALGLDLYLGASVDDLTSPPAKQAKDVIYEWARKLPEVYWDIKSRARICKVLANAPVDALWRRSVGWLLCALSGVMKIVSIINSHLAHLKTYADFDKVNPQ